MAKTKITETITHHSTTDHGTGEIKSSTSRSTATSTSKNSLGAGTIIGLVFSILLICNVFRVMYFGYDIGHLSFTSFLNVMGSVPDVSQTIIDWFLSWTPNLAIDIPILGALLEVLGSSITFVAFIVGGLVQLVTFIVYLAKYLLFL